MLQPFPLDNANESATEGTASLPETKLNTEDLSETQNDSEIPVEVRLLQIGDKFHLIHRVIRLGRCVLLCSNPSVLQVFAPYGTAKRFPW